MAVLAMGHWWCNFGPSCMVIDTTAKDNIIGNQGADHCKYPRTYASPEDIQRMEVYEFARVTGNSQFILLPFQPYKLIYALMLAEAGKINEALRYCQVVLKTLKTAGHAADVCKEAAVALEERLRIHSQVVSPAKGTPNRGVFTSFVQRVMGFIKTPSKEPTPERPQPVVSGIPPMPPSINQYVDTFNKGSITPSKTPLDSPPLFGMVPKASAKPLAPVRFFVPAAAATAAPDINSNHSVDPSSALAFVPDTAFSNGNGPFAAAAFAQLVVQDMRNDLGPTPDHLSSSCSPAMFYLNHYPAAPSTILLPPPPALEVTLPVIVQQQQQNQHQESSIHQHHNQQSSTVGFEAASSSGVFGDDLQEVEL
ncbi:hypothetical protein SELMODRAFT_415415 [Selaginella moellendorffii]|uniref:Sec16 Sec23-binding domain-containing protein n=1 Tax=Selaginella moellendorffii TaxID=88036 RepID=D8RW22_SELML|nr:hypothetical protein SELMODRAFT_415415 [Selaginella moellendorffii]